MELFKHPNTQNIDDLLAMCPVDSTGMYEVGPNLLPSLELWMDDLRMLSAKPTPGQIASGIQTARILNETGAINEMLSRMEFISESKFKRIIGDKPAVNAWLSEPLYANPTRILGAESFQSWQGRGYQGSELVDIREHRGKRASNEQIMDYATRDTQLPYLSNDGGINLVLRGGYSFLFSSNAHRAAAAKLRNEPLGFRRLSIYTS